MALTTRLEFRQSQALVMTPQLMQAIKLLQLSNLDLMTYVEEELGEKPLCLSAQTTMTVRASPAEASGDTGASGAADGEIAGDWMDGGPTTSRNAMEDELGTRLDNVFPEDGGHSPRPAMTTPPPHEFGMGQCRLRRSGGWRIQSRSLCLG